MWLDRCRTYFDMYHVPVLQWVSTATLYMDGHAALWLQAYKRLQILPDWASFCEVIEAEFGSDEYDVQMSKLLQLKQTGTVADYRTAFEASMYHLLSLDVTLSNLFFVTQFLLGLKDEIRGAVRLQSPMSVTRAAVLSRIQEEELKLSRPRHRVPIAARQHGNLQATVNFPAPALARTIR